MRQDRGSLTNASIEGSIPSVIMDDSLTEPLEDGRLLQELNRDHHIRVNSRSYGTGKEGVPLPGSSHEDDHDDGTLHKKRDRQKIDKQSLDYVIRSGIAGGIAGSAAKTLIAPLDRVKILFQTSNPEFKQYSGSLNGLFKAVKKIYVNDGVWGLYQGHSATLLRIFPYAAIKFVAYEQIRTILIPNDNYETGGRRLLAGSMAGVTSVFCTYPLDLIRVRLAFQTNHDIKTRGRLVSLIKTIYHEKPLLLEANDLRNEPMLTRFLIRRTQKGLQNSQLIQAVSNFYRGFAPSILGMIPYAGVSFYTHDLIHDIFRSQRLGKYTVNHALQTKNSSKTTTSTNSSHDHRPPLKTWAQLIAGGTAGVFSQTALYPFEVIRRRMQVGGVVNKGQFFGVVKTSQMILKELGFKGFYVGLSIGFIKVIPMFSCSFFVYERVKSYLGI